MVASPRDEGRYNQDPPNVELGKTSKNTIPMPRGIKCS